MAVNKREMGVVVIIVLALVVGIEGLLHIDFVKQALRWFWTNTKHEYWLAVIAGIGIILTGGVGGVFGACYRRKCHTEPCFQEWWDLFVFGGAGAASAFAVVVVCKGLGLAFGDSEPFYLAFKLYGLTFVSGFFAMRLLPSFGNMMEKQVGRLTNEMARAKTDISMVSNDTEYYSLITKVESALRREQSMDCYELIGVVEKMLKRYPLRRTINIFYGRLLKSEKRYADAVVALKNYIRNLEEDRRGQELTAADRSALAAAHFNIACYTALQLSKDFGPKEMLDETRRHLENAARLDEIVYERWGQDTDLKALYARYPDFLQRGT